MVGFDIDKSQQDVLKELSNVGVGNAATALSKMLEKRVNISIPLLRFVDKDTLFDDDSASLIVSHLHVVGDLKGHMIFLSKAEMARKMVNLAMFDETKTDLTFDEMELSAYNEIANVICGAYLSSLSDFSDFQFMPEPPSVFTGNLPTIKEDLFSKLQIDTKELVILSVDADLSFDGSDMKGYMYFMLNIEPLYALLGSLKQKFG